MSTPRPRAPSALRSLTVIVAIAMVAFSARAADAGQTPAVPPPGAGNLATRSALLEQIAAAERASTTASDAAERQRQLAEVSRLRQRLDEGDFRVGDRIALRVLGDSSLNDTLVVMAGPMIRLRGLADVSLHGVLRSELRDSIAATLARYVREPGVQAVPLMRVAILGEVARPGFYTVPFETVLGDAIMVAGGPAGGGDMHRASVQRGSGVVLSERRMLAALESGATLDQLDLRAGDEIIVPARNQRNWPLIFGIIGTLSGLMTLGLSLRGSH